MDTEHWIALDKVHCWHPFTQQDEWVAGDPLVIVRGDGVWLLDSDGERYIDGNSSIWTNIHGHAHPVLNAAISDQLQQVAHTSYLGFANPRASELAERLCSFFPENTLERVFFSDDGSTAMECALKMEIQFRIQTGEPERTEFIAFNQAYHGDTMGAASLGGVSAFFDRFRKFGFPVSHVRVLDDLKQMDEAALAKIAAVVIEPLVQGVNQIHVWEKGMLRELRAWCDAHGVHLILDEVMTGFGRTGTMFACQQEEVIPDYLCLAKGLTGGYMPLAATMVRGEIYEAFRGGRENAFYYGHSYTANPLGCAAALASLDLFEQESTLSGLPEKAALLSSLLGDLKNKYAEVFVVRQCGMVAGVELRQINGQRFPIAERVGEQICYAARKHALLTRPILDTIVIMPPLSISTDEIQQMCGALERAIMEVFK
ncbi:MAG: adenosylmethionine--8-amino-7-oxononanoate transaminase [Akkermansiaceae bacterium]